MKKLATAKKFH